jgi:hypothetical protein
MISFIRHNYVIWLCVYIGEHLIRLIREHYITPSFFMKALRIRYGGRSHISPYD